MAQIPIGNFGQAVARPGPMAGVPQGNPIGQATERMTQIGGAIANDMERQRLNERQAQLDEIERQRHAQINEIERQRRQDALEEKQARVEAERAQALVAMNGAKDKLSDLHDQIAQGVIDGTVPKDKAEATFAEQSGKLLSDAAPGLPTQHRELALAELGGIAGRLGNGVRKAVTQRDRQDVTAGISQTLEYLQRQYKADPTKATQQAMDTVDQLGPFSTLGPDQLGKLKQSWKEGAQYTTAYEMVSAGRNDARSLTAAEKAIEALPDLDPQKRATLVDRAQSYRMVLDQKAEMATQRAQRESERRMANAAAEFSTFQSMVDKGTALDPTYIDRVITATAGTPYQPSIKAMVQQAAQTGGLAAQPVQAQQQALDQVNAIIAQRGRSPELDKRKDQIEKVVRASQADLNKDALRAGLERGVISDLQPLNPAGGMPGLLSQLPQRVTMAQRVGQWAGRDVSPMTNQEATAIGSMLKSLPPVEFGASVAALSKVVPPEQLQAMATQVDGHDKPLALALAAGSAMTSLGRPVAELIKRGDQVMKEKMQKLGEKGNAEVQQLRADIYAEIGDALAGNAREQVAQAATLLNYGLDDAGSKNGAKRAVNLAIGGSIADHNGRKTPLAAGVTLDQFRDRLSGMPADAVMRQAPDGKVYSRFGPPQGVSEFLAGLPTARLEPAGTGAYFVRTGSDVARNAKGQPIVIEVR